MRQPHFLFWLLMCFAGCLAADGIDKTRLPIGDGKISESPKQGYVWPCQTAGFGTRREHGGPWINSDGTYDFSNKPAAAGEVLWPSMLQIESQGMERIVTGNLLPNHPTGEFPKSHDDPTYPYAPNPHPIKARDILMRLPTMPVLADRPSCVPMGAVGIMLSGSAIFNGLDANGQDAVAHEIQDRCQGHPERNGTYHYHNLSTCLNDHGDPGSHSPLLGYAFDGFGIYGHRGEQGKELRNADLDACHGHVHEVLWDGERKSIYHYHATWEFPYTVGCYRGTPQRLARPPNTTATRVN